MIYSDWRFCQNIQLTSSETADYLDILYALSEKCCSLQDRIHALDRLAQLDELCQAYAIPVLTDLLFLPEPRKWLEAQEDRNAADFFLTAVKEQLAALFSESQEEAQPVLWKNLRELVQILDGVEWSEALEILQNTSLPTGGWDCKGLSYLESDRFAAELIVLALLRRLSREYPDMVQKTVDSDLNALFQAACSGLLGILPQRLALEIQLNQGTGAEILTEKFPKDWLSFPEYMELHARAEFFGSDDPFHWIADEITGLRCFQRHNQKGLLQEEPLWFGNGEIDRQKEILCAILWQSILWELAWETDADRCVRLADRLWMAPNYRTTGDRAFEPTALIRQNWITGTLYQTFGPVFLIEGCWRMGTGYFLSGRFVLPGKNAARMAAEIFPARFRESGKPPAPFARLWVPLCCGKFSAAIQRYAAMRRPSSFATGLCFMCCSIWAAPWKATLLLRNRICLATHGAFRCGGWGITRGLV